MHLYALTLQRPTAINLAAFGNFSGARAQEFVVSRGRYLELLRHDESGMLQSVNTTDVFGVIRSLRPFRLLGACACVSLVSLSSTSVRSSGCRVHCRGARVGDTSSISAASAPRRRHSGAG
jgi:splicing factor 3B subunit 3